MKNQINKLFVILFIFIPMILFARVNKKIEFARGEVLVTFEELVPFSQISETLDRHNLEILKAYSIIPNTYLVRKKGIDKRGLASQTEQIEVDGLISKLNKEEKVLFLEPNYKVYADKNTNDPGLQGVYSLNNTGQTGGTYDADIDGFEAWDLNIGNKKVIIGIIDSGIDYDHPDLADNMWKNPGEIPGNNIDDDANGYIDDVYGWDWAYNDNDPSDYCGHGTHCAGTAGAIGNNGEGVSGIAWNINFMALKFLDDYGSGFTSDAISAVEYATQMGATLTSNSWGGGDSSSGMKAAIANSNMLFIAAAGNSSDDNDSYPHYPSSYDLANIIAVASTDHNDYLAFSSCYGLTSVDLGAPGVDILSTKPDNSTDIYFRSPGWGLSSTYYGIISGTSMATPLVAGTAALVHSRNPALSWEEAKAVILDNVDPIFALNGKTVTGGRLNAYNALLNVKSGLIVSPESLNYGLRGIGETIPLTLQLYNASGVDLSVNFSSDNSAFSAAQASLFLANNQSDSVDIYFSPTDQELYNANLTCVTGDTSFYVSLFGRGDYLPNIILTPQELTFNLEHEDSASQLATISNTGQADLEWHIAGVLSDESQTEEYPEYYYEAILKGAFDNRVGKPVNSNSGGPDTFGYSWLDSDQAHGLKFEWIDISSTGISVSGLGDDNFVGPFPIGFTFSYYDVEYTEFYIASNGFIGFGSTDYFETQNNDPLPRTNSPNNLLAWCWDDLNSNSGEVYYQNIDGQLVVQFVDYGEFNTEGTVTAEVILYKNGTISFQYLNFQNGFDVLHSTVGIENADGSDGLEVVFNNSYLHDSLAVRFGTNQWLTVTPQSGTIEPGGSSEIKVSANSFGLSPATYLAYLSIFSNDLDQNPTNLPVTMSVAAQQITFSTDMNIQNQAGYFTPGVGDYVAIVGIFNEWSEDVNYKLYDTGGGIYKATFPMYGAVGDTIEFKYFIHPGDGRSLPNGGWEDSVDVFGGSDGNRGFLLTGADQTLPTVFFNNTTGFPTISTSPDSLIFNLFEDDSLELDLVLENVGVADLTWDALIRESTDLNTINLASLARRNFNKNRLTHQDSLKLNIFSPSKGIGSPLPVTGLSTDPTIFYDGFEQGNYANWTPTGGYYTIEATTETAANGVFSLKLDGYGEHLEGVQTTFASSTPKTISFFVRPTSTTEAHCYFVVGDDYLSSNYGIAFFFADAGNFRLYASDQFELNVPYNINEWYHIEFRNLDFVNKKLDYYINSQLIESGFPFRSTSSNYVSSIYLYNFYNSAIAYYDDIAVGDMVLQSWITVTPDSGIIPAGGNQTTKVSVNTTKLPLGRHQKLLAINSNDPQTPIQNVPIFVNVEKRNPPEISVTPDSFEIELFEGDSTIKLLSLENTGIGDLEWDATITRSSSNRNSYTLEPVLLGNDGPPEGIEKPQVNIPLNLAPVEAMLADLTDVKIIWDISHGQTGFSSWSIIIGDLTSRGATVLENRAPITPALLKDYQIFWTPDINNDFTSSEKDAIKEWIHNGGSLLLEGDNSSTVMIFNSILSHLAAGIIYDSMNGAEGVTTNIYPHLITSDVDSIYLYGNVAHISSVTSPAEVLIEDVLGSANTAYSVVGRGKILAMADELFYDSRISNCDHRLFANQAFDWLAQKRIGWLSFTPKFGSITPNDVHEIKLKVNATDLPYGEHKLKLTINSNDQDESVIDIPVNLSVLMPDPPDILVAPDSVYIEVAEGGTMTQKLQLSNTGVSDLEWSITVESKNGTENEQNMLDNGITAVNLADDSTKILAWITYADLAQEYTHTLQAISQYYDRYTVSQTTVTDSSVLRSELADKQLFLIPEQESGSSTEFTFLGTAWKNVLNNFVTNGGVVILCGSTRGSEQILKASGLMDLDYSYRSSSVTMSVLDTSHYLTQGLSLSIPAQDATIFYNCNDSSTVNLVTYNNMVSVAVRDIGLGHVVLIGFDFYSYDDNAAKIISNAAKWAKQANWLRITPTAGTISPDGSQEVNLEVHATKLAIGDYSVNVNINSNDPDEQIVTVPVDLTVLTPPQISVIPDSFQLELVKGDTLTQQFQIGNAGAGDLNWGIDVEYGYVQSNSLTDYRYNPAVYQTTFLYNQFKHLASFNPGTDNNNPVGGIQNLAHKSPIPLAEIDSLAGFTKILAWTTYADLENEYPNTLNAIAQYYTNFEVTTTTVTDSADFVAELTGKNVLLIPEQEKGNQSEYAALGNVWQTILTQFVETGGTIILCGSSKGSEQILKSSGLMELDYYDTDNPSAMTVLDTTHFLTNGLPVAIPALNATRFYDVTDSETDVLVSYDAYVAIAAKEIGNGHVVLIGFDFYTYDDHAAQIISNAVKWSMVTNWLTVAPDSGLVTYQSSQDVSLTLNTTGLTGGKYTAHIVVNSNDPLIPVINVPVNLTLLPQEPPLISVTPDTLVVELAPGDTTSQTLSISNAGQGKLLYNLKMGSLLRKELADTVLQELGSAEKWLATECGTGSIQADSSTQINIFIDGRSLVDGTYKNQVIQIQHNAGETAVVTIPVIVKIKEFANELAGIPKTFDLAQNYPNPFNPETTIKYQLPEPGEVLIRIYDVLGREVISLVNKKQNAGYYNIKWNGKTKYGANAASGIYFCLIKVNDFEKSRKLLLMK